MAGRKQACRVNRIIRTQAVEQCGKEVQLIRTVILFKYVPCGQRGIVRVDAVVFHVDLGVKCGRMHYNQPVFVCHLVPAAVAGINLTAAGVAVHGEHKRCSLLRMKAHAFRHVYIPLAHPAADLLIVVLHADVAHRVTRHTQVTARSTHPAALAIQEVFPYPPQQTMGVMIRSTRDDAVTHATGFLILIYSIGQLRCADIFILIWVDLSWHGINAGHRFPVLEHCAFAGFHLRIVDHPGRHRDIPFADAMRVRLVHKAIQIGAKVRARRREIVRRNS